jgi:hypothetical protein
MKNGGPEQAMCIAKVYADHSVILFIIPLILFRVHSALQGHFRWSALSFTYFSMHFFIIYIVELRNKLVALKHDRDRNCCAETSVTIAFLMLNLEEVR